MKRPKYKKLYLKEKSDKETLKQTIDFIIEELKNFDLYIYDETNKSEWLFNGITRKVRIIDKNNINKAFSFLYTIDEEDDEDE